MFKKYLYTAAYLNIFFIAFHFAFPFLFRWNTGLASITRVNKGILWIFHIECLFLLLVSAILSFMLAKKDSFTKAERGILLFYAGFYIIRIITGPILFGISTGEFVAIGLCVVGAACYLVPALSNKK